MGGGVSERTSGRVSKRVSGYQEDIRRLVLRGENSTKDD